MENNIKSIQKLMRKDEGIDGDAQRISQLSWILFLKILDTQEQESSLIDPTYTPKVDEKFQWRNWAADPEGLTGDSLIDFVDDELFPYLRNLNTSYEDGIEKIISDTFEDNYNFIKSGTILRQVLNKINQIDFASQDDRHIFGDIYEDFLVDLQSAGNAGEYYTPRAVTKFIIEALKPQLGQKIFDPASGTGGFLRCSIEYLRKHNNLSLKEELALKDHIFAVEKKPIPYVLCITNMLLNNINEPLNIQRDNTLTWDLKDKSNSENFDIVVSNPPFGGMEEKSVELNFPKNFRSAETADLFLYSIMTYLKDGGDCAVILPDGYLSGEEVKTRIKKKLFTENFVHTIIRLPNKVFYPYTDIATNIIFFKKGRRTKETWYYFQPPPSDYSYTKKQHIKFEEFVDTLEWMNNKVENSRAIKVTFNELEEREFNLDIKNPNLKTEPVKDFNEVIDEMRDISKNIQNSLEELKSF